MKTITELVQELKNKFAEKKVIAPVESSSTASQSYAVGKKFFYNNILYRATSAINNGGTITPGTNCTAADSIETQIDTTNSNVSSLSSALTTVESSIAPIQDGTNYSTAYNKGTRFMRGGKLYKVTASSVNASTPINTGVGGNATEVSSLANDSVITKAETISISSKVTGSANAVRVGNVVQLSFELTPTSGETIASNNEVLVSGLPMPAKFPYCTFITNSSQAISCIVSIDGELKTYFAANAWTSGRMDGTLVYLVERAYT